MKRHFAAASILFTICGIFSSFWWKMLCKQFSWLIRFVVLFFFCIFVYFVNVYCNLPDFSSSQSKGNCLFPVPTLLFRCNFLSQVFALIFVFSFSILLGLSFSLSPIKEGAEVFSQYICKRVNICINTFWYVV